MSKITDVTQDMKKTPRGEIRNEHASNMERSSVHYDVGDPDGRKAKFWQLICYV